MAKKAFDVVCIGNLVADLIAYPLLKLPLPGDLALVDGILLQTGGCAANTAANLARLGVEVAAVGRVGNDFFGEFVRRDLRGKGVDISGLRRSPSKPTSRTIILPITGEDRRFVHTVGANAEFGLNDIDPDMISRARVLYVGGYLLLPGLDRASLAALFHRARGRGAVTVLDVAGARPEEGLAPLREVLPHTDVFLPNSNEARALTGESDPVRQARTFVECGAGTSVVTLGSRGLVAATDGEALKAGAFEVEVVDPSGAGDAFDAGYIFGLLKDWDLRKTLAFASALGASACAGLGCTAGVFTEAEAEDFLAKHNLTFADC